MRQLVIVTGGHSEVAIAVARHCARVRETQVLLTSRGRKSARVFRDTGGVRIVGGVDLCTEKGVKRLRETVNEYEDLEKISLVSCVGQFAGFAPLGNVDLAELRSSLESNLIAAHGGVLATLPAMLRIGCGTVLLVGSHAVQGQFPLMGPFLAAKAGLESYARTLASEYSPLGINAMCVAPATIDTRQERALRAGADMSRWLRPDAVANLLLVLLSSDLSLVNGTTVQVFQGATSFHSTGFLERIGPARQCYPGFETNGRAE